jgi:hypothetical protein
VAGNQEREDASDKSFHGLGKQLVHDPNFAPVQTIHQAKGVAPNHSTFKIFATCFAPPKLSCGWSPVFFPRADRYAISVASAKVCF